jgi:hypothetical protein
MTTPQVKLSEREREKMATERIVASLQTVLRNTDNWQQLAYVENIIREESAADRSQFVRELREKVEKVKTLAVRLFTKTQEGTLMEVASELRELEKSLGADRQGDWAVHGEELGTVNYPNGKTSRLNQKEEGT